MHAHRWRDLYILVGLFLWLPGKQHDIRLQNEGMVDLHLLVNCDWWESTEMVYNSCLCTSHAPIIMSSFGRSFQ